MGRPPFPTEVNNRNRHPVSWHINPSWTTNSSIVALRSAENNSMPSGQKDCTPRASSPKHWHTEGQHQDSYWQPSGKSTAIRQGALKRAKHIELKLMFIQQMTKPETFYIALVQASANERLQQKPFHISTVSQPVCTHTSSKQTAAD